MIEQLSDLPEGTLGFCLSGGINRHDIETVLEPAVDLALDQVGAIKALLVFGDDFEGITLGPRLSDGSYSVLLVSDDGAGESRQRQDLYSLVLRGLPTIVV